MKKKTKNNWWLLPVIVGVLLLVVSAGVIGLVIWTKGWNGKSDFKLAVITSGNLAMISVSPTRGLVNIVEVDGNVPVWVPSICVERTESRRAGEYKSQS